MTALIPLALALLIGVAAWLCLFRFVLLPWLDRRATGRRSIFGPSHFEERWTNERKAA